MSESCTHQTLRECSHPLHSEYWLACDACGATFDYQQAYAALTRRARIRERELLKAEGEADYLRAKLAAAGVRERGLLEALSVAASRADNIGYACSEASLEDIRRLTVDECRKLSDDALAALAQPAERTEGERSDAARALREFADQVDATWGSAYPEDVPMFAPLPLGSGGVSDHHRTRISAMMGRHMSKRIAEELRLKANVIESGEGSDAAMEADRE